MPTAQALTDENWSFFAYELLLLAQQQLQLEQGEDSVPGPQPSRITNDQPFFSNLVRRPQYYSDILAQ